MGFRDNKHFNAVQSLIASLEQQHTHVAQIQLQDFNKLHRELTEHFEECIKALMERQDILTKQLIQLSHISSQVPQLKEELAGCIKGCKVLLAAGIGAYNVPKVAEQIWQSALKIQLPPVNVSQASYDVMLDLPASLLQNIESHGQVITSPRNQSGNLERADSFQESKRRFYSPSPTASLTSYGVSQPILSKEKIERETWANVQVPPGRNGEEVRKEEKEYQVAAEEKNVQLEALLYPSPYSEYEYESPKRRLIYDICTNEPPLEGLSEFIVRSFRGATKYDSAKTMSAEEAEATILLTFVVVHNRPIYTMEKPTSLWKHFVILVCGRNGRYSNAHVRKFRCTMTFKALFDATEDSRGRMTGGVIDVASLNNVVHYLLRLT